MHRLYNRARTADQQEHPVQKSTRTARTSARKATAKPATARRAATAPKKTATARKAPAKTKVTRPARTKPAPRTQKGDARTANGRAATGAAVTRKRRRTRSQATRQEIIDAAIDCFLEIGYARTTTTEIAQMSGYTRGAVQYYFPTTRHVLKASIDYLTKQWLASYTAAAASAPPGTDAINHSVDLLWKFVNDRLFLAWQELVFASRTDKELRKIIMPAAVKFEQLRRDMGQTLYPEFHDIDVEKFQRNRDTLRFILEGIMSTVITYQKQERIQAQLDWLKEWFHRSWEETLVSQGKSGR
jgi:AcrR family transcriptional regulator